MANNTIEYSKAIMIGIIVILIILLFMFVPGLRDLFTSKTESTGTSGGSAPVNVKVNGEPVRSTTSTTTKSDSTKATTTDSTKGTSSDSAVNVDVKDTKDGTSINITVPDTAEVNAQATPRVSVGPLPGL